tara:strand:+ start:527 stop:685 length:159 start_codon:yes stop_codon:yes gene_type:complete
MDKSEIERDSRCRGIFEGNAAQNHAPALLAGSNFQLRIAVGNLVIGEEDDDE